MWTTISYFCLNQKIIKMTQCGCIPRVDECALGQQKADWWLTASGEDEPSGARLLRINSSITSEVWEAQYYSYWYGWCEETTVSLTKQTRWSSTVFAGWKQNSWTGCSGWCQNKVAASCSHCSIWAPIEMKSLTKLNHVTAVSCYNILCVYFHYDTRKDHGKPTSAAALQESVSIDLM